MPDLTRRQAIAGSGAAAILLARDASASPPARSLDAALTAIAAKLVTDRGSAGAGLGVGGDGRASLLIARGSANLETGSPVTPATVFRIASCTKQFTAAAVLLLAEQGKLALDAPIDTIFPGFPAHAGGARPTVHQLLSHISGIHDYVMGGLPADAGDAWRYDPARAQVIARMTPLYDFAPGTQWNYSNSNYVLLGALIEKLSGSSYGDFVETALFRPLGMTSTALDHHQDLVRYRAAGYGLIGNKPGAFHNAWYSGLPVAEGGLRSTTGDLLRWNAALFGGRVLTADSLKKMTTAVTVAGGIPSGSARFVPPGQNPGKPPAFVEQADYGYGLEISRMFGHPVIWHSGGYSGFNSILMHFPDRKLDVALLTNTDNGAVPGFEPVLRTVLTA